MTKEAFDEGFAELQRYAGLFTDRDLKIIAETRLGKKLIISLQTGESPSYFSTDRMQAGLIVPDPDLRGDGFEVSTFVPYDELVSLSLAVRLPSLYDAPLLQGLV